jgi:hypothetical protein
VIDRKKLLPASLVCFCLFLAGLVLLVCGCEYLRPSSGLVQPGKTTFEQVLAWSTELGENNDHFADSVITLQRSGFLVMTDAKSILLKQVDIARANQQLSSQIRAASACATQTAGSNASPAELDSAGAKCARISAAALAIELNAIRRTAAELNTAGLAAITDPAKQKSVRNSVVTIGQLAHNIVSSLAKIGILPEVNTTEVR